LLSIFQFLICHKNREIEFLNGAHQKRFNFVIALKAQNVTEYRLSVDFCDIIKLKIPHLMEF
jgi:hypothetical protein